MDKKAERVRLPKSVKITIIIVFTILAMIAAVIIYSYLGYKNQTESEASDDYPEQYTDEKDIAVSMKPVTLENGIVQFNQNKEENRAEKRMEELRTLIDSVPEKQISIGEVEKITNSKLDSLFQNYTVRIVSSGKTNGRFVGYHIQTQALSPLAPVINMVVTPDTFLQDPEILEGENIAVSKIDGIPFHVFFDYSKRKDQTSGNSTDRYNYEVITFYNDISYYIKLDFRGLNYELDQVETTKENTSAEAAALMQRFVKILKQTDG